MTLVELLVENNSVHESEVADVSVARDDAADVCPGTSEAPRTGYVRHVRLLEEAAHPAVDADALAYLVQIRNPAPTAEFRTQDDVSVEQRRPIAAARVQRRTEVVVADDGGFFRGFFPPLFRRVVCVVRSCQLVDDVVFVVDVPAWRRTISRCILGAKIATKIS